MQENFYSLLESKEVRERYEVCSSGPTDPEPSRQVGKEHHDTTSQSFSNRIDESISGLGGTEVTTAESSHLRTLDTPLYAIPDKIKSNKVNLVWVYFLHVTHIQ